MNLAIALFKLTAGVTEEGSLAASDGDDEHRVYEVVKAYE